MKWIFVGLGVLLAGVAGGLTAIVAGYRQVIGRYLGDKPEHAAPKQTH